MAPEAGTAPGDTASGALRAASRAAGRAATRAWLFAALIGAWWAWSGDSTSVYFPPLPKILRTLWSQWAVGPARAQLGSSLEHLALGYAIAGLAGIGAGALLWSLRYLREATSPYLYFLYVLPAPVLVPAIISIFGIGAAMKVVIIAFAALWPTLLNTLDGMRGVDAVKLDTARALRMSGLRRTLAVVLPAAAPQVVAGLRNSLQVSIILMVVSEWVASTGGIGYYIVTAQESFDYLGMWSGILVLAIVGFAANLLFVLGETRLL